MGLRAPDPKKGSHKAAMGGGGLDPREGLSDKAAMGLRAQTQERALTQAANFNPARWGSVLLFPFEGRRAKFFEK